MMLQPVINRGDGYGIERGCAVLLGLALHQVKHITGLEIIHLPHTDRKQLTGPVRRIDPQSEQARITGRNHLFRREGKSS